MTENELRRRFPRASTSFIKANADPVPEDPRPIAIVERDPGDGALGAGEVQAPSPGRYVVRFTSVRKRLIDEENLCSKFHTDALRYARILHGDNPAQAHIIVTQRQTTEGEEEHVTIEITQE